MSKKTIEDWQQVGIPDDPNRKERRRTVSIDIETIPDPEWVDMKQEGLPAFDMARYFKDMKRGDLNAVAEGMGVNPKPYKTAGDLTKELLRVVRDVTEDDAAYPVVVGLEGGHEATILDDVMSKAVGLRALASKVVAIGVVSYFGDAEDPSPERTFAVAGNDESHLIESVYDAVEDADLLTGFNLVGFDGPMLRWRACLCNVDVPPLLWGPFRRYYSFPHCDTMFELGNWDPRPRGTLEEWCWRFGLDAPAKTDWREILAWYTNGDWEALKSHVMQDTIAAGALYQRIQGSLRR